MPARRQVKAGERFGRWTALRDGEYTPGLQMVDCRCDCGTERSVSSSNLRGRKIPSCGCMRRDSIANLSRLYEGVRGTIWMRSSWEVAVAHRLDRDGLSWEYEPETFRLDEHTRYTPDFKVDLGPLGDLWVEVKGEFFGRSEDKVAAFRATGRPLYLVGKDNFKQYSGISPYIANRRYPPRLRAV